MDALTWVRGNEVYNSNSFLDPNTNRFDLYRGNQKYDTIGGYKATQQSVNGSNPFFVTSKYRFLGVEATYRYIKFILRDRRIGENGSFTAHIKIKAQWIDSNTRWWNPLYIDSPWQLRMEVGQDVLRNFNVYTNGKSPNIAGRWSKGDFNQVPQCATIVLNGSNRTLTYYINGQYISMVGTNEDWQPTNAFLINHTREGLAQLANMEYHSIRFWNAALTADEVRQIAKIEGIV